MLGRRAILGVAAALALSAAGLVLPDALHAQPASKAGKAATVGPTAIPSAVRYPAYPVAKRIEPIVPPRTSQVTATVRKGVATASVAKKVGAPKVPTASTLVATKPELPGKSALGAALPLAKTAKGKPRLKQAAAKR